MGKQQNFESETFITLSYPNQLFRSTGLAQPVVTIELWVCLWIWKTGKPKTILSKKAPFITLENKMADQYFLEKDSCVKSQNTTSNA